VFAYDLITGIGHFFPTFNLAFALLKIQNKLNIAVAVSEGVDISVWDKNIAGNELKWMIGLIPLYFVVTLFIDNLLNSPKAMGKLLSFFQKPLSSYEDPTDLDDDVVAEQAEIAEMTHSTSPNKPNVFVHGLKKQYGLDVKYTNTAITLAAIGVLIALSETNTISGWVVGVATTCIVCWKLYLMCTTCSDRGASPHVDEVRWEG
jgi:hypothetical protein